MFKDYRKYLTASLKVYLFVLVIITIMKIVGLDYFGLDMNNQVLLKINNFCLKFHLDYVYYTFTFYVYLQFIIGITIKRKLKFLECFTLSIISLLILIFVKPHFNQTGIFIFDVFYLILISLILKHFKQNKITIKRCLFILFLNTLFQVASLFIRNVGNNEMYFDNFILWQLLNFDYILLSIISYTIYFTKGDNEKWVDHSLSLLKKINLKNLLKKLQKNLHNFKSKEKVEKISIIIYIILSLIWNTLSLIIILLVAKLNHSFVECIFILTSFWLSKRTFGKPFHLSSMAHCFIVSNLTYYALNRVTTPLGISILVPIMLGVGLSYVTSKLVKKIYKPLHKGMSKETFEETIVKVVDKDSDKYKICYDYYINKKGALYLGNKYNYTEAGIRKILNVVNNKIKELN